ncbi:hypothetical protein [Limnoglobus roseus]|uniref:Uncharacterized protein n=1 Tax=Limnoglobus roseus TaxID=2598579 RepID=A0A5C1A7E3_9BACT|nr:hypothetical protein [Limnoglobus roseus]QEL14630.1 hypothetical protein PX52LOC_01522 [Limnoglobus roseus]
MCQSRPRKLYTDGLRPLYAHETFIDYTANGFTVKQPQDQSGEPDTPVTKAAARECHRWRFNEFDVKAPGDRLARAALLLVTGRRMEKDVRGQDVLRLVELVSKLREIAERVCFDHARSCDCPTCVHLLALDEARPGLAAFVWAGIEGLPAALGALSQGLSLNLGRRRERKQSKAARDRECEQRHWEVANRPELRFVPASQLLPAAKATTALKSR